MQAQLQTPNATPNVAFPQMMSPWGFGSLPPSPQQFGAQFHPFMHAQWGSAAGFPTQMQLFAAANQLPLGFAAHQVPQQTQMIPQPDLIAGEITVEAWCHKYSLGDEECQSLIKLGFKVGDKLDSLSADIWEWAGVPPLRRMRILDAYAASKAANTST